MDLYKQISELKSLGKDAFLVTVVEKSGMAPSDVGKKMLVLKDGNASGTIGGGAIELYAINRCKSSFANRISFTEKYILMDKKVTIDNDEIQLPMACGGKATLFYEFIGPKEHVYIFGGGHCGKALAKILTPLDFYVTIIDNRQEILDELGDIANEKINDEFAVYVTKNNLNDAYIVVATPSHTYDFDVLDKIIESKCEPAYFGMLCSKKKINDYLEKIKKQYNNNIDLKNFYSPIGLDLGGDSPEEIAISIASEILAHHYKKDNPVKHMNEKAINKSKSC